MKKCILLILTLSICGIQGVSAEKSAQIDSLNFILFEDIPQEEIVYAFHCHFEDKDYSRKVRYNDLRGERIRAACEAIRHAKDYSLLPSLKRILLKQEAYFLQEWEVAWKDGGGPRNIYDDQYGILMELDVTISYLIMQQEKWSAARKYDYVKNLYMLNQGDYDETRVEKTLFVSDYIKNVKKGFSTYSLFLPSTFKKTLLDQMADEFIDNILSDLETVDVNRLTPTEKKYYLIGLRKIMVSHDNDEIEKFIITNPAFFDALDDDKIPENEPLLSAKYYHLLLDRYMLNNENPELLVPIADDLFEGTHALEANKIFFRLVTIKAKSTGTKIFVDRLADKIADGEESEAKEYMELSRELLGKSDELILEKKLMGTNARRATQYHKLINKISDN